MITSLERILNPEYEVCLCRHLKTGDVLRCIKDNQITNLKDLCELARVGDKCGGCREELEAILDYCNNPESQIY